ncbi:MAG: alpha/beta hydrolase [Nitratireductor sp.]|nr:alpha/beta hydrolase [Nitratireductor sp.]
MKITVDGEEVHLSTGGREHRPDRPFVMFLHGAGFNHFTWVLQGRALAYDGYNIIAADMPGHCFSAGKPLEGIEAQAEWALKVLDAVAAGAAVLVAHSQGGLIALEMARTAPERVRAIAFVATAAAIPVNGQLIALAEKDPKAAYQNMVDWGYGSLAHLYENTYPGASHLDFGLNVMAMGDPRALAADLRSCAAYDKGAAIAATLACPVLCVFAGEDRMTPVKFGKKLAGMIPQAEMHVIGDSGHTIPTERPRELNACLRSFLARLEQPAAA